MIIGIKIHYYITWVQEISQVHDNISRGKLVILSISMK